MYFSFLNEGIYERKCRTKNNKAKIKKTPAQNNNKTEDKEEEERGKKENSVRRIAYSQKDSKIKSIRIVCNEHYPIIELIDGLKCKSCDLGCTFNEHSYETMNKFSISSIRIVVEAYIYIICNWHWQ